jgi:hypothetical protein
MIIKQLASLIQARANCIEHKNDEWLDKHEEAIQKIMKNSAPSGAGFDSGTKIDLDRSTYDKIIFTTSYHHMNEDGYYDGWTDHTIIVRPTFDGIDLSVSGRNRNEIKDYIYETFDLWLTTDMNMKEILFDAIMAKPEIFPALLGIDKRLDELIHEKLSGKEVPV